MFGGSDSGTGVWLVRGVNEEFTENIKILAHDVVTASIIALALSTCPSSNLHDRPLIQNLPPLILVCDWVTMVCGHTFHEVGHTCNIHATWEKTPFVRSSYHSSNNLG